MVWIHGGGWHFSSGNRDVNGPDYFMDEDIIIVTINYRLGALGEVIKFTVSTSIPRFDTEVMITVLIMKQPLTTENCSVIDLDKIEFRT
jgi:hypothetical protein